jgi:hypothetical protein
METIHADGIQKTRGACQLCAKIADFIEIDNPQDEAEKEVFDDFSDEVKELVIPNPGLERYYRFKNEQLRKCPYCGTYYRYRRWAPGGSEDVMRTYIHESITRLGFLKAHKELQAALYESSQRAQEYGHWYLKDHQEIAGGIQDELRLLKRRYREIVSEAISCLENKHEYSLQLAEFAAQFLPTTGQQQVEEARQKEEEVARYHAEILVEYLRYYEGGGIEDDALRRMTARLADDNEQVRRIILNGLIEAFASATSQQGMAEQLIEELRRNKSLYPEAQELLEVCRGYVG